LVINLRGNVFTGNGEGRKFLELNWVTKQIVEKLGFKPYPGTLNLYLPINVEIEKLLENYRALKIQPEKGYFPAHLYRALLMERVFGAIIRPKIPNYPKNIVEIIAPTNLREIFKLKDGAKVTIELCYNEKSWFKHY
jgi:riboflavin kinase